MSIRTQLARIRKDTRAADVFAKNVWHGDSGVTTSGSGVSWETAFKTIAEILVVAKAGDTIKLRGEFNESGLEIEYQGIKIIGEDESNNHYRTFIYSNAATPIFIIKANDVSISNLGIAQQAADLAIQIGDASGQAWYKAHIDGVKIDGWSTCTGGVGFGHATVDAPDLHIENCLFRSIAGTHIVSNATRGRYNHNILLVSAANIGIEHVPTTASRPDTIIHNNRIFGVNSTDTGIKITNTPDAGTLKAYDNYIFNCATTITQKAENVSVQMNYTNDAAGGVLIDPIA